jgi:hypothetical protein
MKIVTAMNLESWAGTIAGRADLPELIGNLIRTSCKSLEHYRFPSGDASQTHGWDGVADVVERSTFVPEGRSVWEMGAGANYKAKADEDFKKRTEQLTADERSGMSFIFVTPRIWDTGLEEWVREHSGAGWQSVLVYDANSLELWLADYPTVSIPLAKKLGIIPPTGVQTVQDFWDEYSLNVDPPIKEALLLTGREERAKRLCESLSAGLPNLSKLKSDSATEAAAFIAASVMSAESELSRFLRSKTLFVDSLDAARRMPATGRFALVLLPEARRLGPALARTNQVTLVLGNDDIASDFEDLGRMDTRDFAVGLRAMGLDEQEAFQLAGICGRSVTVLSRLNASATVAPPKWRDIPEVIPLVLAGGWDASNQHDRAVVARLCGKDYGDVDTDARKLAVLQDAPLDREGSIWTLRSSQDAFTLFGALIGTAFQQRLRDACIEVFSEIDRTLDVPDEKGPIIPIRGADFQHSEWLRRGLGTTLLLISALHEAAKFATIGETPQQFVDRVVAELPGLTADVKLLASLKSEFPKLAEAAPVPLVSALERVLEGDSEHWKAVIFRDKKEQSFLSSTSPHTYILWALETLAWDPTYLPRAASILMTLAHFDPGGAMQNRPLHSLRDIFLAWRPSTYALVDERIAVLRRICRARPKVGLDLAMSLLPVPHDHTTGTAKPRLRDFGNARSKVTTVADMESAYRGYAEIAIELAGTDVRRLTALVEHLPQLDPISRESMAKAIRFAVGAGADPDDVFELWSKLRVLIGRHRQFQNTNWAIREADLKPLEALRDELAPRDSIRRTAWLFDDLVPEVGPPKAGDYVGKANHERRTALSELLEKDGLSAAMELAKQAKLPYLVGFTLAQSAPTQEILESAIDLAVAVDSGIDEDFVLAISVGAHERFGVLWDEWIGARAKQFDDVGRAANLFLRWNDSRETWTFVASLGEGIEREYWKRKRAFKQASDEDLFFALDKYIAVGRFGACLDTVSYEENRVPAAICVSILRGFIGDANDQAWQRQHFAVLHMIETLQKRDDIDWNELAALEYQLLPLLEHQGEPVALQSMLNTSPQFFVGVICDTFFPSSEKMREVTKDRRLRASYGYQLLQSMKSLPGFSSERQDIDFLKTWISEARRLGKEADREVITNQQIGQILAYAPSDSEDKAWPMKPIRDLIEDFASDEIERGISISRFNMRGSFWKALYDGGKEERAFAAEYRQWAEANRLWPRTSAMLRRIATDWDRSADMADTEAQLDQLRDA